jgi:hypothetical protein
MLTNFSQSIFNYLLHRCMVGLALPSIEPRTQILN